MTSPIQYIDKNKYEVFGLDENKRSQFEQGWKQLAESINPDYFCTLTFYIPLPKAYITASPKGTNSFGGEIASQSLGTALRKFHSFWRDIANPNPKRGYVDEPRPTQHIALFYAYDVQPRRAGTTYHFHAIVSFHNKQNILTPERIQLIWKFKNGNAVIQRYDCTKKGAVYALVKHPNAQYKVYCPKTEKRCDRRSKCFYDRKPTKWRGNL